MITIQKKFDAGLLSITLALTGVGLLLLYSASQWEGSQASFAKQALFALLGTAGALALARLPSLWLRRAAPLVYLAATGVLALVLIPGVGMSAKGAQRWLSLGPLGAFQPSELAKLALILALAAFLDYCARAQECDLPASSYKNSLVGLMILGLPTGLVIIQPDLGTALTIAFIGMAQLFVAGFRVWWLLLLGSGAAAALPHVLKEYQKDRLLIYLHPEHDPMGMGYSLMQSKTAIGSGGIYGHGWLGGPMSQTGFVPENWTDFIFTVVGEEFGLIGGLGYLLLVGLLLFLVTRAAFRCRTLFGALVSAGVLAWFGFQVLVNVGMTIGCAPVVGLPLPLASYGGTALGTNLLAVGAVLCISEGRETQEEALER